LAKNRAVSETARKPAPAVNPQNGLGIEFRNEHSMFRDFEQLKLQKKTPSFNAELQKFHKAHLPSTEKVEFAVVSKFIREQGRSVRSETEAIPQEFINDVDKLNKAFKGKNNAYNLYMKSQTGKVKVPPGKRFSEVISIKYKQVSEVEKRKLTNAASHEYGSEYRKLSSKWSRQKLMIPQFLNPYTPAGAGVARADLKLWNNVNKEVKNQRNTDKFVKKGRLSKNKENREAKKAARERYGFHKDLLFIQKFHMMFIMQQKKANPNKTLKEIMQIDPKKVLSKLQITKLQKESDKLLEQYNQQNAVAAKKAIAAKDWAVLKKSEVQNIASEQERKEYAAYLKELNSQPEESEGKPAKNFDDFLAKELTRIRAESRQKYGFEPNLKFSNTAYKLYMAKNNVSPGTVKNWKSKISKIELTQLEKEAAELKRKFEQKNQFAAKKAIAAHDWHALQMVEVRKYGTADDLKAFKKAKTDLTAKISLDFTAKK